jgi:hypothetical protein
MRELKRDTNEIKIKQYCHTFFDVSLPVNNTINSSISNSSFMNTGFNCQKNSKVSLLSFAPLQQQIINFCISLKKSLTISSFNIHSLQHKFHEIVFLLDLQLIDILVINETWLDQSIDSNLFESSFYQMIRRDRSTSSGGGIIVYIKKSILVKSIIIDEFFETISFIFQLPNKFQISVIARYRPESKLYSELDFLNHLSSKLKKCRMMFLLLVI